MRLRRRSEAVQVPLFADGDEPVPESGDVSPTADDLPKEVFTPIDEAPVADYPVDLVFGATGLLAKQFPGYLPRRGQIMLTEAVDAAIVFKQKLLAEAPTGTGKSIAYAVPAIFRNANGALNTLIVTANIALQEQLVTKDLPLLQRVLPWPFKFALAKGRSNYLCLDRYARVDEIRTEQPGFVYMIDQIAAWAKKTDTGDVSELDFQPDARVWSELSVGSEQCKGKHCPHRKDPTEVPCFVERAKTRMKEAGVVVTNYHLFFADMIVRASTNDESSVLPAFKCAILDEGHKAADIARDFFGFKCTEGSCKRLTRDALKKVKEANRHIELDHIEKVEVAAAMLFETALLLRKSKDYKARLKRPGQLDTSDLVAALIGLCDALKKVSDDPLVMGEHREAVRKVTARGAKMAVSLRALHELAGDNFVYFIDEEKMSGGGTRAAVGAKLIDASAEIADQLMAKTPTVVVTSATLTTSSGFKYIAGELGLTEYEELEAPSPFNLSKQALLVCPSTICEPNEPEFIDQIGEKACEIIRFAKGRTLLLFTSYRNLDATHRAILSAGLDREYRIIRQGEGPRTKLIEEFRRNVSSCLLGTASFWEGVDVPGEALSCVVVDRLPFITPEDPVLDAVSARDEKWFHRWMLPRAIIAFRQGFGRLVRSVDDRGVVVVLDRRLLDKPYGRLFVRGTGGAKLTRRLADIGPFLAGEPI